MEFTIECSNSANKKAYNTFAGIVRNDFSLPDNFAAARNAFGRVAMGLHGYRLGAGEYGCHRRGVPFFSPSGRYGRGWGGDFVGWAPRTMGFHLRREGGRLVNPYGPMVPERPDARLKPGELRSGGYGFYYKGNRQDTSVDVLDRLAIDAKIKPLEAAPRPEGQGLRYSEEITSGVYFSNDKLQNVLASHGIVIDAGKKTLTVQSALTKVDLQYDLKTDELEKLTASALEGKDGVSLNERLGIINNILIKDFSTPLTKDMLETKDLVRLDLRPEVRAEVEAPFIEQERRMAAQQRMAEERASGIVARTDAGGNYRSVQSILLFETDQKCLNCCPIALLSAFIPNRSLGPISSGDVKVFSCSPESKECLPLIYGSHKT